jgi:heme A synthase
MPRFAKFCWFVISWTILVILWGAYVRASGSGAGCGNHWPTCNGEIIPRPRQIETTIEFIHRLLSGGALILIFSMAIWGWRTTVKGNPVRIGLAASVVFILTEALLGASLVLFHLVTDNQSVTRAAVMALHLLNTFLLLGALTLTAWWASGGKPISFKNKNRIPFFLALGLTGVALIGMSGAITALGDTLFPVQNLAQGLSQDSAANAHFLVRLRVYHPLIAILVGVYSLYLINYLSKHDSTKDSNKIGIVLGALIVTQWAAGLLNVILLAPVPMQIVHLFIADLVWITYVLFSTSTMSTKTETIRKSSSLEVT